MRIGFITCRDLSRFFPSNDEPLLTKDDRAAAIYLRERGHAVEAVPWGTPLSEIGRKFDALIIRSPWDYSASEDNARRFLGWCRELQEADIKVLNELDLILWNLDKHYLRDFEGQGVAIVPTEFVEPDPGLSIELLAGLMERWGEIVVKPCVSAGARDTFLLRSRDQLEGPMLGANGFMPGDWRVFQGQRSFMVQPFLPEVCERGEWSLLFFDGEYSHSVRKLPKPGGWLVQDELGGSLRWEAAPDRVVEQARQAMAILAKACGKSEQSWRPLYARVDMLETSRGILLGELEAVEPELFFLNRTVSPPVPYEGALKLFERGLLARVNA